MRVRGMYVCVVITYGKSMDQPGKVANPARGQLIRENLIFSYPRSCLIIWFREMGSAVASRVSLLTAILRLNMVLPNWIPPEFRGGVHLFILNRHMPPGQCQVYRVRTDGVHSREFAAQRQ